MQTTPCGTMRFSFFLRNSFLRFELFAATVSGAAAASLGSFATLVSLLFSLRVQTLLASHCFLLRRYRTLPRTFACARIRVCSLAAHRQVATMTESAVALNFNQPANVHLSFFAEIAFHAAFRFNGGAQMRHFLFRKILDLLRGIHFRLCSERTGALLADTINGRQSNPQSLVRR